MLPEVQAACKAGVLARVQLLRQQGRRTHGKEREAQFQQAPVYEVWGGSKGRIMLGSTSPHAATDGHMAAATCTVFSTMTHSMSPH